MKDRRDQIVFNRRYALVMLNEGFKCVNVSKNRKFPDKMVYYFKDTAKFRFRLNELIEADKQ